MQSLCRRGRHHCRHRLCHYRHNDISAVATTRQGFAPSLLLIIVCCLLLHLPLQLSSPTRHLPALPPSTQPPLPVPPLPLWQPSPSGRDAPAEDGGSGHLCLVLFGREGKLVYFSPNFTEQRAFFRRWSKSDSFWREHESGGIWRNPEESGGILCKYRNSCPTGIPAKNPCESG